MNINLIFYGEDGEVEYGGSKKQKIIPFTTLTILEKFISKMVESYKKNKQQVRKVFLNFHQVKIKKD